jgi:hypothetical protein
MLKCCRVWGSEHIWVAISGTWEYFFLFQIEKNFTFFNFYFVLFLLSISVLSPSFLHLPHPTPAPNCDTFICVEFYGFSFYELLYPVTLNYSVFSGHYCLMIYTVQFNVEVSDWKHLQISQQHTMCHFIPLAWKRLFAALILQTMVSSWMIIFQLCSLPKINMLLMHTPYGANL